MCRGELSTAITRLISVNRKCSWKKSQIEKNIYDESWNSNTSSYYSTVDESKLHGYIVVEKYEGRRKNNWRSNECDHLEILEEISWRSISQCKKTREANNQCLFVERHINKWENCCVKVSETPGNIRQRNWTLIETTVLDKKQHIPVSYRERNGGCTCRIQTIKLIELIQN